jgi:chemotaxis protein CheC
VHQIFSGHAAGDAVLLLNCQAAGTLTRLLTDGPPMPLSMDVSARELLTEVGNILLNACLGTFGNLLKVQVSFSVPRIGLGSLDYALAPLVGSADGRRYALVVPAGFKLRDAEVRGVIVVGLGAAALERLIRAAEVLEPRLPVADIREPRSRPTTPPSGG